MSSMSQGWVLPSRVCDICFDSVVTGGDRVRLPAFNSGCVFDRIRVGWLIIDLSSILFVSFPVLLGMEPRTLCMLGRALPLRCMWCTPFLLTLASGTRHLRLGRLALPRWIVSWSPPPVHLGLGMHGFHFCFWETWSKLNFSKNPNVASLWNFMTFS
jgi:hypothetical protein